MKKEKGLRRPPVAIMTVSAAKSEDCQALRNLMSAGAEVVVVEDHRLEETLRIVERVRRETR